MIGRPSQQQFEFILNNNLIRNCPVTVNDAWRALIIYGPDVPAIKGKTIKPVHVPTTIPSSVPLPILSDHGIVTLCIVFFMQGLPFFHTVSRKLKFCTVSAVKNLKKETILSKMNLVLALYRSRGFQVVNIHSNMEFECMQHDFLPITLNLTPHHAHVGEVEQSIWTIKERVHLDIHGMSFKRLPKLMIIELIRRAVMLLNAFPALDGVSKTLSP